MQAERGIPLPEFEELTGVIGDTLDEEDLLRQFTAAVIATSSLLLGLIGNVLFYANPIGINIFLYVTLFALAAFILLSYFRRPVVGRHGVFIVPALTFALLLGVRLAPQLILFNTVMMGGSLLIVIHFTGVRPFLGRHWSDLLQRTVETAAYGWVSSLQAVVPDTLRWLGRTELDSQQIANVKSGLRGVVITLPVVAVFTLPLGSADAVFGNLAERTLAFFCRTVPEA
jgi:hypothetical protein